MTLTDEQLKQIGERIRTRRKALGLTLQGLAKQVGVSHPAILNWEKGATRSFREPYFSRLASALKTTPQWLLEGKGPEDADEHLLQAHGAMPVVTWEKEEDLKAHGEYVFVPRVDIEADCGQGACVYHEHELDQRQAFRVEWFAQRHLNPRHCTCIYARGDSMEPRIFEGDTLLIDRSPSARENIIDGKIYLLRYGTDIRVKQLFKRFDGGLIIRSFNSDKYPEEVISKEELASGDIDILGRVVWIASEQ